MDLRVIGSFEKLCHDFCIAVLPSRNYSGLCGESYSIAEFLYKSSRDPHVDVAPFLMLFAEDSAGRCILAHSRILCSGLIESIPLLESSRSFSHWHCIEGGSGPPKNTENFLLQIQF